ncbi:MAG: hypothetical protein WD052_05300 [Bacteroidales bacterium]
MKNYLFLASISMMFLISCERVSEFTKFNLVYDESVVIPSSAGVNLPFNLFTPDIESNAESQFAINDTRKDMIEEITLTTLNMTITSPSNGTFSFLKEMAIFLVADSLPEIEIASKYDIPNSTGNVLELETTGEDIQEYIKKDQFSLRLHTVTDEMLSTEYHLDIHAVFYVDAKILGL